MLPPIGKPLELREYLCDAVPTCRCTYLPVCRLLWIAYRASSKRSETPSLSKMLCRWFLTVCSLMNIFSAISLFFKPCHQRHDFALALAERRTLALAGRRRRNKRMHGRLSFVVGDELADDGRRGVGIEPDFAGVDFADTLEE